MFAKNSVIVLFLLPMNFAYPAADPVQKAIQSVIPDMAGIVPLRTDMDIWYYPGSKEEEEDRNPFIHSQLKEEECFDDICEAIRSGKSTKQYNLSIERQACVLDAIPKAVDNLERIKIYFENKTYTFAAQKTIAVPDELIERISEYCDLPTLAGLRLSSPAGCVYANRIWPKKIVQHWGSRMICPAVCLSPRFDESVEKLLHLGVSANMYDVRREQPLLFIACLNKGRAYDDGQDHDKVAKMLLETQADPNVCDKAGGRTPLMMATCETSKRLLECRADVDTRSHDSDGALTALMLAVMFCNQPKIQLLLEHNADKTIKNCENKTAQGIALEMAQTNPDYSRECNDIAHCIENFGKKTE